MDELIGQSFGSYRVVEKLGEGGMAVVYKGYQASLNRYVAIKVLRGDLAHDQEFVARFHREALAVAKLSHPNILHIYDTGVAHGVYYIVMDYAEGGSLSDLIRQGPIDASRAVSIAIQMAGALDYAHREGLIHRDVKPSNILLSKDGRPLLSDFGIAKIMYEATQLTRTGATIGTPEYMAPEQVQGQPSDGRADIYALGVVLYEMLAGTVPFRAATPVATLYKHVHEPLPPLRQANSNVPAWLEAAVYKALAKRPEDRFQRASAFARALRQSRVLDSAGRVPSVTPKTPLPRDLPPTTPPPRSRTPVGARQPAERRRSAGPPRLLLAGIGVLSLVVVVGLVLLLGGGGNHNVITPQVVTSVVTGAVQTVVVTPVPPPSPVPTAEPTQAPTAEPTRLPTIVVVPTPTPAPNWDIPSLQANVTDFRFFEGGAESPAYEDRQYSDSFAQSEARYIYYELHLEYPEHQEAVAFDVDVYYYKSDGSILGQFTANHEIEADWTSSYHTWGWGWPDPGNWPVDTYLVELYIDGELIASGSFDIY
jgi:serine/threonine protein kinase